MGGGDRGIFKLAYQTAPLLCDGFASIDYFRILFLHYSRIDAGSCGALSVRFRVGRLHSFVRSDQLLYRATLFISRSEEGTPVRLVSLFAAGLICGVLWEFWNYWAHAKWVYTVPIMQDFKVFEMPLVGYLGFPAFALECFAMMTFVRWLLKVGMTRG